MANIGSTIGGAIQTYVQKQEEKKQNEAGSQFISNWFKSNPTLAASFKLPVDEKGEPDKKAISEVIKGLGGVPNAVKSFMAMSEFEQQNKARQQQEQAASYAAMLRQGGGQVPSPVSNQALAQLSPQARIAGEAAYLQSEQARANLGKTQADTAEARARAAALALPKAGPRLPSEEALVQAKIKAWEDENPGKTLPSSEEAKIRASARADLRPVTTINTGDNVTEKLVAERLFADRDTAVAAQRALPSYDEAEKILKSGKAITGTLADARLTVAKALSPFGINQDNAANTEVLRAQLAIPVLSLVKQLGSGAGISNADRDFAEKAAGGSITLTPQAILRLTEIGRKASKSAISNYNERLDRVYPEADEGTSRLRRALVLPSSSSRFTVEAVNP
jgi:hypothetical protein